MKTLTPSHVTLVAVKAPSGALTTLSPHAILPPTGRPRLMTSNGDPMHLFDVYFRAARRRTTGVAKGMRIWVKPVDACLTRNIDLHPEARIFYAGEVEAPDADAAAEALNICYEAVVLLRVKRLRKKSPTAQTKPPSHPELES